MGKLIPLYQNKSIPWNWLSITTGKFEKHFFFYFKLVPNNNGFPWWQRYFAYINLGFCHYLKTNINFQLGLNFGKWYIGIFRHY
jgi:hypothetical protein